MLPRSRKICRWCEQPLPEWSDLWPDDPGVYLFYGYPTNKSVDQYPRTMLVTVESYGGVFGTVYRTPRTTLKRGTGAAGFWLPVLVPPDRPGIGELDEMAAEAAKQASKLRMKPIKRNLSRRLK